MFKILNLANSILISEHKFEQISKSDLVKSDPNRSVQKDLVISDFQYLNKFEIIQIYSNLIKFHSIILSISDTDLNKYALIKSVDKSITLFFFLYIC